ncbi:hypothetical protein N798_15885 [Knoellia flava TL1]|uniref:Hcy-binding domain-containing protein n=2 Tax=Knoellia flava TaxID=913969 RepID=A0A8H9KPG4_9MICO|nr:hypothetical protein [Knoellia flava]KGN29093.1 hypothetical protein N798_15885 [Knoellia flava TL1]GGB69681.1 hypothetical protein GCM10011314_06190 [Knoellia flava]
MWQQPLPTTLVGQQRHGVAGERLAAVARRLDAAEVLDEGDIVDLVAEHERLAARLPNLDVVGGCCGTDVRHVAALWGVGA